MAVTASATPSLSLTYSLLQTDPKLSVSESASIGYTNLTFNHGTGIGGVTFGIKESGFLPSGGTVNFDLKSMFKTIYHTGMNINFTGIRGFMVTNTYNAPTGMVGSAIPYFNMRATGLDGFSGLFNGGSGNVKVRAKSTWALTDYVAVPTNTTNKQISLIDSGSGVPYEMVVVGVTG